MTTDPLRSLSRDPVRLTVHGSELTIRWRSALGWIEALRTGPESLVLSLADQADDLVVGLALGEVPLAEVQEASYQLMADETGRRWWTALKLAYSSAGGDVLGELTLCGVDPATVSFGQWCAATYRVLTRNADERDRLKIDSELELPPPGYEEAWDDGNDFEAMVALARKYEQQM